jgi:hypothetical protein
LRFKANAGDEPHAHVTLLIDQEVAVAQGAKIVSKRITINFMLLEEEKIDAVSPDGAAQLGARLVDVSGKPEAGATQQQVDDYSLALDELKIQFRRTPRGEIAAITLSGVRPPLDDKTARMILNNIYGASRGPILPEEFVEVGATWKTSVSIPTPFGITADANYTYVYKAKEGDVAIITGEGTVESKPAQGATPGKRLAAKSSSEYRVEVSTGRLVSSSSDATTEVTDGAQTTPGFKQRIKVAWNLNPAAGKSGSK